MERTFWVLAEVTLITPDEASPQQPVLLITEANLRRHVWRRRTTLLLGAMLVVPLVLAATLVVGASCLGLTCVGWLSLDALLAVGRSRSRLLASEIRWSCPGCSARVVSRVPMAENLVPGWEARSRCPKCKQTTRLRLAVAGGAPG